MAFVSNDYKDYVMDHIQFTYVTMVILCAQQLHEQERVDGLCHVQAYNNKLSPEIPGQASLS